MDEAEYEKKLHQVIETLRFQTMELEDVGEGKNIGREMWLLSTARRIIAKLYDLE